jgi:hypothetical protein
MVIKQIDEVLVKPYSGMDDVEQVYIHSIGRMEGSDFLQPGLAQLGENAPPAEASEKIHLIGVFNQAGGELADGETKTLARIEWPENRVGSSTKLKVMKDADGFWP